MFFENVKFRDVLIKPIPRRLCTVSKQRNADDRANREHNVDISCNFTLCIKLNRLQDIVSGSERYDTLCDQNNRLRMKKKTAVSLSLSSALHTYIHMLGIVGWIPSQRT